MLRFFLAYKKIILILLLILFPLLILSTLRRQSGNLPWYEYLFLQVTSPISSVFNKASENVSGLFNDYVFIVGAKKENKILNLNISRLEEKIAQLNEVEIENKRLRKLLDFSTKLTSQMLPAEVVATAPITSFKTIKINKGSFEGVNRGMAVVTADGVVGRVVNVIPHYSNVLLLSDPLSAIDVLIQRTRARGILEGAGGTRASLKYIRRLEDVQVGDSVVTSGLGGSFPKGIIVGKVSKVNKAKYGMTQDVQVSPSVDFHKIEEIFVVKSIGKQGRE